MSLSYLVALVSGLIYVASFYTLAGLSFVLADQDFSLSSRQKALGLFCLINLSVFVLGLFFLS